MFCQKMNWLRDFKKKQNNTVKILKNLSLSLKFQEFIKNFLKLKVH